MEKEQEEITTIKLKKGTRNRLGIRGNKTETYDDIVTKLLDKTEEETKWKELILF